MSLFLESTDPALRNQILKYHISEVMTDVERAQLLGLPEGCRIRERAKILAPEKLTCGKHVWIGEGAVLDAQGGLTIGDHCQIGLNTMIWTHNSRKQAHAMQTGMNRDGIEYRPTKIGNGCFIAGPSVITAGVTIGDRVAIAPFSLVQHDVEDGAIVSPALDKMRTDKRIDALQRLVLELMQLLTSQADAEARNHALMQLIEKNRPKETRRR